MSQADFEPKGGRKGTERVDRISLKGRDVTDSEDWEYYEEEPLLKVKVTASEIPEEARVAFWKTGVIRLYNRNFTEEQQILALKHLLEVIVSPLVRITSFQQRLSE